MGRLAFQSGSPTSSHDCPKARARRPLTLKHSLAERGAERYSTAEMADHVFYELLSYVGFGPRDGDILRDFHTTARPHFARIADLFYQRILEHPAARRG